MMDCTVLRGSVTQRSEVRRPIASLLRLVRGLQLLYAFIDLGTLGGSQGRCGVVAKSGHLVQHLAFQLRHGKTELVVNLLKLRNDLLSARRPRRQPPPRIQRMHAQTSRRTELFAPQTTLFQFNHELRCLRPAPPAKSSAVPLLPS